MPWICWCIHLAKNPKNVLGGEAKLGRRSDEAYVHYIRADWFSIGEVRARKVTPTQECHCLLYTRNLKRRNTQCNPKKYCLGIFFLFLNKFIKSVFCCQNALVRISVAEITANINCESARRLYSCYQFMALWLCIRYARARELLTQSTITSHLCRCFVCFRDSDGRCVACCIVLWASTVYLNSWQSFSWGVRQEHEGSWLVT